MSHTPTTPLTTTSTGPVAEATVTDLASRRGPGAPPARPAPLAPPPGPDAVAALVRAVQEVRAGVRPLEQVAPLLAPSLTRRLGTALRDDRRRPAPTVDVHRVLLGPPTPSDAIEGTVLLRAEDRLRALAVRLERHHGGWRATELTGPEDGHAPLRTASSARAPRRLDAFDEVAAEAAARQRLRLVSG